MCTNIKRARAEVSRMDLTPYFDHLKKELDGVLPQCIINYDETNISDDPGRKKILTRRGSKRAERVIDYSKSSTSVMFSGTANGELLPPYIVYKAENLYTTWTEGGPTGCRYNRSRSGWFDNVIFKDWFDTVVLPYFDKIDENQEEPTTKVMIGDNLSSHLSLDIIEKCKTHNIRFMMLPHNATHLCQPFDVAFFKGLKVSWRRVLTEWKLKNRGNLPKDKFPELLKKVFKELSPRSMINLTAGFRAGGIYPFNPNEVTKRLPQDSSQSQPSDRQKLGQKLL